MLPLSFGETDSTVTYHIPEHLLRQPAALQQVSARPARQAHAGNPSLRLPSYLLASGISIPIMDRIPGKKVHSFGKTISFLHEFYTLAFFSTAMG